MAACSNHNEQVPSKVPDVFVLFSSLQDGTSAQSAVRMTVQTLAQVLSGEISRWDHPRLVTDNLHLAGVREEIAVLSRNENGTRCEHSLEVCSGGLCDE